MPQVQKYLEVPFEDKDQAKSMGARFDMACKKWYVPYGVNAFPFRRWWPAKSPGRFNHQAARGIHP